MYRRYVDLHVEKRVCKQIVAIVFSSANKDVVSNLERTYVGSFQSHGGSKMEGVRETNACSRRSCTVGSEYYSGEWPGDRNYTSRDQYRFNSITCFLFMRRFCSHGERPGPDNCSFFCFIFCPTSRVLYMWCSVYTWNEVTRSSPWPWKFCFTCVFTGHIRAVFPETWVIVRKKFSKAMVALFDLTARARAHARSLL